MSEKKNSREPFLRMPTKIIVIASLAIGAIGLADSIYISRPEYEKAWGEITQPVSYTDLTNAQSIIYNYESLETQVARTGHEEEAKSLDRDITLKNARTIEQKYYDDYAKVEATVAEKGITSERTFADTFAFEIALLIPVFAIAMDRSSRRTSRVRRVTTK